MNIKTLFLLIFISISITSCATNGKNFGRAETKNGLMESPSNLKPVFYNYAICEDIDSGYFSTTRYDGSIRPSYRLNGHHGGTDWSLNEGTELLSILPGRIIHKGSGGQMEGNYIWLIHSPAQTGMPYWIFTKYQHLLYVPDTPIGATVKAGEVIAKSGSSGTKYGHYKQTGYPHLHLGVMKSKTPNYTIENGKIKFDKFKHIDPLTLFKKLNSNLNQKVDGDEVLISYVKNKNIIPYGSKIVWPIACRK